MLCLLLLSFYTLSFHFLTPVSLSSYTRLTQTTSMFDWFKARSLANWEWGSSIPLRKRLQRRYFQFWVVWFILPTSTNPDVPSPYADVPSPDDFCYWAKPGVCGRASDIWRKAKKVNWLNKEVNYDNSNNLYIFYLIVWSI